jgi:hypothetical protein
VRLSGRGNKVPNYAEEGPDSDEFASDEVTSNYYVDPNAQFKEEDENDPEDLFQQNIVGISLHRVWSSTHLRLPTALPHQVEEFLALAQH